jgi:hypothetical protein
MISASKLQIQVHPYTWTNNDVLILKRHISCIEPVNWLTRTDFVHLIVFQFLHLCSVLRVSARFQRHHQGRSKVSIHTQHTLTLRHASFHLIWSYVYNLNQKAKHNT